jgi:hypothetical protein
MKKNYTIHRIEKNKLIVYILLWHVQNVKRNNKRTTFEKKWRNQVNWRYSYWWVLVSCLYMGYTH